MPFHYVVFECQRRQQLIQCHVAGVIIEFIAILFDNNWRFCVVVSHHRAICCDSTVRRLLHSIGAIAGYCSVVKRW